MAEEPGRKFLRKAALAFEEDAKQRGAIESAEVNRYVTAKFIAVTGRTYVDEVTLEDVFKFHKALRRAWMLRPHRQQQAQAPAQLLQAGIELRSWMAKRI